MMIVLVVNLIQDLCDSAGRQIAIFNSCIDKLDHLLWLGTLVRESIV